MTGNPQATASLLMLVSSDLDHDPRVQKEAYSAHESGYDVTVICRHSTQQHPFEVVALEVGKPRSRRAWRLVLERLHLYWRLLAAGMRNKPDIVHANDLDMLPVGWLLATLWRAALVYDAHESWTDADRGLPTGMLSAVRNLEGALARRCDGVVTVSDQLAERMKQRFGLAQTPRVVLNAPRFEEDPPKLLTPLRDLLRLPDGPRVVLFQGIFRPGRGLDQLIESMLYIEKDVYLVLRGYGPHVTALRSLVERLDLSERVRFAEPVPMDQMVAAAVSADIGVIPLLPRGQADIALPNKLFEYLMAGLPVVASRLPALAAIVESEGVGWLFDPLDPEDIARVIDSAVSNKTELEEMRVRVRSAARRYCWERQYEVLESVYRNLGPDRGLT